MPLLHDWRTMPPLIAADYLREKGGESNHIMALGTLTRYHVPMDETRQLTLPDGSRIVVQNTPHMVYAFIEGKDFLLHAIIRFSGQRITFDDPTWGGDSDEVYERYHDALWSWAEAGFHLFPNKSGGTS